MRDLLQRNRAKINKELSSFSSRKYFSPWCYGDGIVTLRAIAGHLRGACIDIGCGDMPYRAAVEKLVDKYESVDIEPRAEGVTYIADVQSMNMIRSETYDSALCLEVLEHVTDPAKALSEINRILKKGATLVCSVPHLSRLHEEPNDYYRFTKYGLAFLFERAGFRVISIEPVGGLFCFLGHQISTALLLPLWHIPIVRKIAFLINKWFVVKPLYALDGLFDKDKIFAVGYTCVVKKKQL